MIGLAIIGRICKQYTKTPCIKCGNKRLKIKPTHEMSSKRRNSNSLSISISAKQHQITKFMEKNSDLTKGFAKASSTKSALQEHCTKAGAATAIVKKGVNNKRTRPDTISPESITHSQPTKKQIIDMPGEIIEREDNKGDNPLNLELMELKRQLFEGFDALIDEKLSPLKKDIQELKNKRKLECSELNVETLTRKIKQSDAKHKKLENRLSQIEDQLLEKNIIFQGFPETEFEDSDDAKRKVIKAMFMSMPGIDEEEKKANASKTSIECVEHLGKYNPLRARPVKVRFGNKSDADHVLKQRKKLPKGIFVEKEYSKATEHERRLLHPIIKAARRLENYKGLSRLDGPQLVIDGKCYNRENLHTLPADLDTTTLCSKTDEEVLAFFGELHLFSNFHQCSFSSEGHLFHSSEQYIQWKKACFFGDTIAQERLLNSDDALECKNIKRDIRDYNKANWNNSAEEQCFEGIKQKFLQNPHLMQFLTATGEKTLVESSYDDTWGTGLPLSDPHCLTKSKWKSVGILGRTLMSIHGNLQSASMECQPPAPETE